MTREAAVPEGYERAKMGALEEVCRRMLEFPEVREAIAAERPLRLTCPRGHHLTTIRLELDPDGLLIWPRPIASAGRRTGAVATPDDPFKHARRVCEHPGCPERVEGPGFCDEHGGRRSVEIGALSTRFRCARHGWETRVSTVMLLKSITAAICLGHDSASVTGRVADSRRRVVR